MTLLISRRELFRVLGTGAALLGISATRAIGASDNGHSSSTPVVSAVPQTNRGVVADPADIPPPIHGRAHSIHHGITLEAREVDAEIEPGPNFPT
jgi:nitrite reductase (NO-forming)